MFGRNTVTFVVTTTAIFLPSVMGWNIAFYDEAPTKDSNGNAICGQSGTAHYAVYSGTGQGDCIEVGNPGDNCAYYTEDGGSTSSAACTAPFSNPAQAFSIQQGTVCNFFEDAGLCQTRATQTNGGNQEGPNAECGSISQTTTLSFKCHDG